MQKVVQTAKVTQQTLLRTTVYIVRAFSIHHAFRSTNCLKQLLARCSAYRARVLMHLWSQLLTTGMTSLPFCHIGRAAEQPSGPITSQ